MTKRVAVVTGSNGGLGKLICLHLAQTHIVFHWDLPRVDVTDPESIADGVAMIKGFGFKRIDALVNCAGVNTLAAIPDVSEELFDRHMAVNARGMVLTVQAMLPMLERGGTVCNVVSNASHMPMRQSLAYNASKAAAAMITRQMARELGQPHQLTVFGVSPNRLAGTPMSQSVDEQVAAIRGISLDEVASLQRDAMPAGEETDPDAVAEFIGFLLSAKQRHKYLHGAILEYGI